MKTAQMDKKIGLIDAIAIGIGGMVGGGIFAVLGLAVSLAKGGTPLAFLATYTFLKAILIEVEPSNLSIKALAKPSLAER